MADPRNEVIVLCLLVEGPLILPDNLVTTCSGCGRQVQYRPDPPLGPKMCAACALPAIIDGAEAIVPTRMIDACLKRAKLQ
jgi:hypothetical protein